MEILEESFKKNPTQNDDDHIDFVNREHGFQTETSTCYQLLRAANFIKNGFNQHFPTNGVFLDVKKAFDRMWHNGLLFNLIRLNLPHISSIVFITICRIGRFESDWTTPSPTLYKSRPELHRGPYSALCYTASTPTTSRPLQRWTFACFTPCSGPEIARKYLQAYIS
ncbi:putative RNA-directed DNA polymerase from transposon X-element [Trichonephila clavipes]|nr:putative RNA-directed DNA polymerase from transposon X-element [Trichonephila clavipes]